MDRQLILNSKGSTILIAVIISAVGLLVAIGVLDFISTSSRRLSRVERQVELQGVIQEIQTGVLLPETCLMMFAGSPEINLNKMSEAYDNKGIAKPGQLTQINLLNGESLVSSDGGAVTGLFADGKLKTAHLAWTNRVSIGRNGPNGFPLYEATLFGSFTRPYLDTEIVIYERPITTAYIEVNPGVRTITYCTGKTGSTISHAKIQCNRLNGAWRVGTSTCVFTALAPPPLPIYPPAPTVSDLGKPCGATPSGKVRKKGVFSMYGTSYEQCVNGSWRQVIYYSKNTGDAGG